MLYSLVPYGVQSISWSWIFCLLDTRKVAQVAEMLRGVPANSSTFVYREIFKFQNLFLHLRSTRTAFTTYLLRWSSTSLVAGSTLRKSRMEKVMRLYLDKLLQGSPSATELLAFMVPKKLTCRVSRKGNSFKKQSMPFWRLYSSHHGLHVRPIVIAVCRRYRAQDLSLLQLEKYEVDSTSGESPVAVHHSSRTRAEPRSCSTAMEDTARHHSSMPTNAKPLYFKCCCLRFVPCAACAQVFVADDKFGDVITALTRRGWIRSKHANSPNFKLKWRNLSNINFRLVRDDQVRKFTCVTV